MTKHISCTPFQPGVRSSFLLTIVGKPTALGDTDLAANRPIVMGADSSFERHRMRRFGIRFGSKSRTRERRARRRVGWAIASRRRDP